jgi:hypothetical protein
LGGNSATTNCCGGMGGAEDEGSGKNPHIS